MHFDEVYHARTATEFLQDWRYGLSHDIYEWTHPHLAKYAMAGRARPVGRGRRQRHERARGRRSAAAAVEPRRRRARGARPARRRAAPRRDRHRDPDLRPADARSSSRPSPAAGRRARWRSTRRATSSSSATTTAGSRRSTSTSIGVGGVERRAADRRADSATVDHPVDHLLVTDDGDDRRGRLGRPADDRRPRRRRRSPARSTCRDRRPRARRDAAPRSSATSTTSTDPAAVASTLADLLGERRRPTTRRKLAGGVARHDGRPRAPGERRRADQVEPRSPTARCPASRSTTCRGSRSPTADGVAFIDPATASVVVDDRAGRRRPRPGHGHRARRPEAVRDRRPAGRPEATTSSRSVATRPRTARSTRARQLRCRAPAPGSPTTRPARGPHPRPRARTRPRRRAVDGLRRRAARQRGLRRRAAAGRVRAGRLGAPTSNPSTRPTDRQQLLLFDGGGRVGLDRRRVARLRLAAARASSPGR